MTSAALPRLAGERVTLVPVPRAVAVAVVGGDAAGWTSALADRQLRPGPGWPHDDTADALRPDAEYGESEASSSAWLVVVDGEVVGDCGWLGGVQEDGRCELGYGLAAPARGQGLGTEAVGVLAAWAEQQPGVRRLCAEVLPGNEASRRLLARLGFSERGERNGHVLLERALPRPVGRLVGRHVC